MSGLAVARSLRLPGERVAAASGGGSGSRRIAFAGLAALAAGQWASLLAGSDPWRFALVVCVALLTAVAAGALSARARRRSVLARAGLAIAGSAAGLVALGLAVDQLAPWNWGELAATLDHGRSGLRGEFDYPLATDNEDARLLLVALLPVTVSVAAVLSFWRRSEGRGPATVAGLCVALAAVAIPATARPTALPLLWGSAILGLVALWMWGGRLAGPGAAVLLLLAGALGAAALVLAPSEPVVNYRSWTIAASGQVVEFQWDHDYGPIDWPRNGTPLFRVEADGPSYWRAEVLDEFAATRWERSTEGGPALPAPTRNGSLTGVPWVRQATFTVLGLESPLVLSPGDSLGVEGIYGVDRSADATLTMQGDPLGRDTSYTVWGYQPEPTAQRLRESAGRYPAGVRAYTSVSIPVRRPGSPLTRGGEIATPETVSVAPWGTVRGGASPPARAIGLSPYRRIDELADRLTADAPTAYSATRSVMEYLRSRYRYDESPPQSALPLKSFLFRDGAGYCQQFSGAMALMLRMVGIPARVAVGFTAGTPTGDGKGSFLVTDLDAHSWVEVYFSGIGWVTFDPTPSAAPAQSQLGDVGMAAFGLAAAGLGGGGGKDGRGSPKDEEARASGQAPPPAAEGGTGAGRALLVVAGLGLMSGCVVAFRSLRHRRLPGERASARAVAELGPALRRAGFAAPGGMTLLSAEERLRGAGRRRAGDYVRRLRESRYAAGPADPPGLRQRLAARRDLGRGSLRRRVAVTVAMPPGGPRAAPGERERG